MDRSVADLIFPIRTERLVIRRFTDADLPASFALRSDPAVARWLPRRYVSAEEHAEAFAIPETRERTLVIEHAGRLIGDLYLFHTDGWAQWPVKEQAAGSLAEIGWTLLPTEQGRGFATEAVRELIRVCFEDLGVRRIVAHCFADNEPSWRLMERVGMRRESVNLADSLHEELGWVDGLGYALLAQEWLTGPGDGSSSG